MPKNSASKTTLTSMPIWVKLPSLGLEYWSDSTLKKIASTLGPVLWIDNATSKHERMMYARVLIEMSIYDEFPNEIYFINEHDELVSQRATYDWKPVICWKCKEVGHLEGNCRSGEHRKRASKPKPKPLMEEEVGTSEGGGAPRTLETRSQVPMASK